MFPWSWPCLRAIQAAAELQTPAVLTHEKIL